MGNPEDRFSQDEVQLISAMKAIRNSRTFQGLLKDFLTIFKD